MAKLVSQVYAEALFEVGREVDKMDQFEKELSFITDILNDYPQFYELIKTPNILKEEKKSIVTETFKSQLSEEMLNFIKILLDKRRGNAIEKINSEYTKMVAEYNKEATAIVETVVPLSKTQQSTLEKKLSELLDKTISVNNVINNEILGGVRIQINDQVLDATLIKKLNGVKSKLFKTII